MDYRRTLPFYMNYKTPDMPDYDGTYDRFGGPQYQQNQFDKDYYERRDNQNWFDRGYQNFPNRGYFNGINQNRDYYDRMRMYGLPDNMKGGREEEAIQDFEYLQQMYPNDVKQYQQKIARRLDSIDTRDSLIYDEYPDRLAMNRLSKDILEGIKQEITAEGEDMTEDRWEWLEEMILILLVYEIFKRRHSSGRRIYNF